MVDQFKEITTKSWGRRVVESIMAVIVGLIFFIGAFPLIFWNEARSVDRIRTLDEGRSLVVAVASEQIDPTHNGALVHFSGFATTHDVLRDPFFGVQENALKLKRKVEMYQWKESKHTQTHTNLGGSETTETTYSYDKVWSETLINSRSFRISAGHENPATMPYKTEIYAAANISIGAFTLSNPFIQQINHYETYPLSQTNFDAMDSRLKKSFALVGNEYFYGDAKNPHIGAMRINYSVAKPADISIVGKQDSSSVQTYYTKNGEINLLEMGNLSAAEMFTSAENENMLITWLIRLGAFILMWIGLAMFLAPLKVLADVVPFIGSIIGLGIGFVTGLVALVVSFTTIAIAWIVFRPLIGLALLALVGGIIFGGFKMTKSKLHTLDTSKNIGV